MSLYCSCETPVMDVARDAGCRRCGLPVDFSPKVSHWHVAYGLAGYGPDGDEGMPTFESLSDALEYARDELARDVDIVHDSAHDLAESGDYQAAWGEVERMESLELLRANLDPKRASAPLYANDPAAYARLQESQAAEFPVDVSSNTRLYLWDCSETECLEDES